ncbi:MAG: alanine--tRNA ligase [Alphaproteobacteria bacterium]|nr:alanine--tRNA ligase [Alphaproteobacteria bacterium]
MKTVKDIRSEFLGFFEKNGHTHVPSSPLVPQNDPTLMFVNSGMVQFKNVFTGTETRDYTRATTAQKSVRAGGKHNDLDNVGYTARHHTFFEMLGNFSFGDYFKEEAISYAWELISKNFQMPKDKLLITVHSTDEEAAGLWKKIAGFSDDRIIRIPTDDNFWQMGDTGPCGPCSEIFYDQGDKLAGGPPGSADEDGDRFLEFWNLVFMQYEQEPGEDGQPIRRPLPKPSIDTGMGLERMAALMQGKTTNYDIDLLRTIIEACADLTGVAYAGEQAPSHRVIADHLRCSAFLLADGVMPSNEGRGYVLRRIMRRGMRHAHLLGAKEPLMYRLLPTLVSMMGEAYPELKRAESLISETLKNEETRFKQTLDRGLKMLDEESTKVQNNTLAGDVAFKLYDTYGFPVDLTADALKSKNIEVDMKGFETCMEEQKAKARAAWAGSGDTGTEKLWFDLLDQTGSTEFLGYETEKAEGKVLALIKDGTLVDKLSKGDTGQIIVNQTPFYGESGGQVGDTGTVKSETGVGVINDVKKQAGKLFVHYVQITEGHVQKGEALAMSVDHARRNAIRANHSVTHLLHEALRQTLGTHVAQKGSLQDAERTRFDISQPVAMTDAQIKEVETKVNEEIRANTPVITRVMPIDEAMESGAMALFGEKYDDEVRVVSMGTQSHGQNKPYSVELCGGTHVTRTGDIGLFKIVSEGAVAAGIRRIEALTGANALAYLEEQENKLLEAARILKSSPGEVTVRVQALTDEKKKLEQELVSLRQKLATGGAGSNDDVKTINGIKFIGKVLENFPAKDLRGVAEALQKKLGSGVVAVIATEEGKASIVVAVTDDLTGTINAVDLVKLGAEALGGNGGGGRPNMAQAGGSNPAAANDAVSVIEKKLG